MIESKNFSPFSSRDKEVYVLMRPKSRADDDLSDVPPVKSSLYQVDGKMRLFVGKGDLAVQKLDKERPSIIVAVEDIPIQTDDSVLVLEAGDGGLGLVMGAVHPQTKFLLYNSDVSMERLTERNIEANFGISHDSCVITAAELKQAKNKKEIDAVIYCPQVSGLAPSSLDLIRAEIALGAGILKPDGKFFLVTKTKSGANSHKEIMETIFGSNVTIIGRGGGGHRVLMAQNSSGALREIPNIRRNIHFSVCGYKFDLESESSLFSKDDLDLGTRILLEKVDLSGFERLLDVGCGWGAIGIVAATMNKKGEVFMVDINNRATEVAKDNVSRIGLDSRVTVVTTDDFKSDVEGNFDLVLSNPPFHANTEQLMNLFKQVRDKMRKNGKFYLVVEKTYKQKLENILGEVFGNVVVYHLEDRGFWIFVLRK